MAFDNPIFINTTKTKKSKNGLKLTCNFCGKKSKHACVNGLEYDGLNLYDSNNINNSFKTLKFCDLICAKLYDTNIHRISINYDEYRKAYNRNELSKNSKIIYEKCKHKLFSQLLIYKIYDNLNDLNDKERRNKISQIKKNFFRCL
jgi:hypothetical protein